MNRKLGLILIVVVVAALIAAVLSIGRSPRTSPGKRVYTLRQEWIPQMTFTGEVVAKEKGFFGPSMEVEIKPGGFESDPIKLVSSGADSFGVAGAERVLKANEAGASLVVIGVVNHRSPTVFLVLEASPIKTPKDFESHAVGVLSGSNTEVIYKALLAKQNVDRKKIKEVEISYDLPGFIDGKFDVLPAFAYDEPLSLKKQNVRVRTINPEGYDVRALGNVYFTTRRMLESRPEDVRRFVDGVSRGWAYAFQHPHESIAMLSALDSKLDLQKEEDSLLIAKDYFQPAGYQLLEIRRQDWQDEVRLLQSIAYLKGDGKLEASLVEPPSGFGNDKAR